MKTPLLFLYAFEAHLRVEFRTRDCLNNRHNPNWIRELPAILQIGQNFLLSSDIIMWLLLEPEGEKWKGWSIQLRECSMSIFYSLWLRLGNGLSRTNTVAVEMDPKSLLSPSCPGLGTRRLVLLDNIQASCCFSALLLGGFASHNLGTFWHSYACWADLVRMWHPNN